MPVRVESYDALELLASKGVPISIDLYALHQGGVVAVDLLRIEQGNTVQQDQRRMERNGIVREVVQEHEQVMPPLLGAEGDGLYKLEEGLAHVSKK